MFQPIVISLFLYFPKDKTEYIPAAITFLIFLIAALITMRFIIVISKREEEKTKKLDEQLKNQQPTKRNS